MKTKLFLLAAVVLAAGSASAQVLKFDRANPASSITNTRMNSIYVAPVPDLSGYAPIDVVSRPGPGSVTGMGEATGSGPNDLAWVWSGLPIGTNVTGFSYLCLTNGPAFIQRNPRTFEQYTAFLPNLSKPLGAGGIQGAGYYFPACPAGSSGYATTLHTPYGDQTPGGPSTD